MKTRKLLATGLCAIGMALSSHCAFAQVLVAGTDFEPKPEKSTESWIGTSDIILTGVTTPSIKIFSSEPKDLNYDFNAKKEPISSHFHDNPHYAITSNPIILDSLDYVDDPKGGYGCVFGPQNLMANKTLMQFVASGLTPNSTAKVVIKYRSVIDDELATKCGNGSARAQFKVAINADQYNQTAGKDVEQMAMGASGTYTDAMVKVESDGSVTININGVNSYSGYCHAFEIMSIEVYGEISPEIDCIDGESVCAGEFANLSMKNITYQGAKFQWYMNGKVVSGANVAKYSYETPQDMGSYEFQLEVEYGGKTFKSNKYTVKTEKCCEVNGVSASRKVVFKDDFGELDLSDPTGKTYKVWDYSDIANPKQVTKKTDAPFRYKLGEDPLNCKFQPKGELVDGEYCVAGVLTQYNAYKGYEGAKLGWAGRIGGKEKPDDPSYDHSGKLEGCALFINCKDQTGGQNIYERDITNLCQNRQLFFECYISVFTNSAAGAYNPVDVTVRLTEIGNESNKIEMRRMTTREADRTALAKKFENEPKDKKYCTGTEWEKISGEIFLEKMDAVKLEIINNVNTDQNGNDLVIDDIIIKACAAPSLLAYYDINTLATDTVTCANEDGKIKVYAKPSEMLTKYFGGEDKTFFLYQWSKTPKDKESWKDIDDDAMTQALEYPLGTKIFEENEFETGDVIYTRVIAGSKWTLDNTDHDKFNADDPCASYTISEAIPITIKCAKCVANQMKVLKSDPEIYSTNSEDKVNQTNKVVYLCKDESAVISSEPLVGKEDPTYKDYNAYWSWNGDLKDKETNTSTPSDQTVSWAEAEKAGGEIAVVIKVEDAAFPGLAQCIQYDTITVKARPVPEDELIEPEPFCEGNAPDMVLDIKDHKIEWFSDEAGTSTLGTNSSNIQSMIDSLKGNDKETYKFYYKLSYEVVKGSDIFCEGEMNEFTVDVREVPSNPKDQEVQMVVTGGKEPFPMNKIDKTPDDYTLLWYYSGCDGCENAPTIDCTTKNETGFTYKITYKKGVCESEEATVTVLVKSAPTPKFDDAAICEGGDLEIATLGAADEGYKLVWYENKEGKKPITNAPKLENATVGEHKYYVTQKSEKEPFPESEVVEVTVTAYGVKAPETKDVEYCFGDKGAKALEADEVKDEAKFYMANGFVWSAADSTVLGTEAPVPSTKPTNTNAPTVYLVQQTYAIPGTKEVCKGDYSKVNVSVTKVADVDGTFNVSYVLSDGAANKKFDKNILEQDPNVVETPSTGKLLWSYDGESFGTAVPTPNYKEPQNLGDVQTQKFWVKHVEETAKGLVCESEAKEITVLITSTPSPIVSKAKHCEGYIVTGTELAGLATVNDNNGTLADKADYKLYWFTDKVAANACAGNYSKLSEGTTTPSDLPSPTFAEGETEKKVEVYVLQANATQASAPNTVVITYVATPVLDVDNVKSVCNKTIDLTDGSLWHARDNVEVTALYKNASGDSVATPNAIAVSGEYEISGYVMASSNERCESQPKKIQLDIQKLKIDATAPSTTCPNTNAEVSLRVTYEYNDKVSGHEVTYTYTDDVKTTGTPAEMTVANGVESEEQIETSVFTGEAGVSFKMGITVSAGECSEKWDGKISLGDGPVNGKVVFTEAGNNLASNGRMEQAIDIKQGAVSFISCGNDVDIDVSSLTTTAGSKFEWFSDRVSDNEFKNPLSGDANFKAKAADGSKSYYLRYTNKCYAYMRIDIKAEPVRVSLEDASAPAAVALCENESFNRGVKVECDGQTNTTWYKDNVKTSNITTELNFKKLNKATHEGVYTFKAIHGGCSDSIDVVDLKVKKYIEFAASDFEIFNKQQAYIVKAGEEAVVPLAYTVPSDGAGVDIVWDDVTSGTKGSGDATKYTIAAVDANHKITIKASGDEFCDAQDEVVVLKDAKLSLKMNLDTAMCFRDEKTLEIDTTGTGVGLRGGMKLEVLAVPQAGTVSQVKNMTLGASGLLTKTVSPTVTTEYRATLSYNGESVDTTINVTVYNFQIRTVPQKVCGGEEVTLQCTVTPKEEEGTILTWLDTDGTEIGGGSSTTATPTFTDTTSKKKSQVHRYYVQASTAAVSCTNRSPLDVTVYRPLEGTLKGATICEGGKTTLDATNYGADRYEWSSSEDANIMTGGKINVTPSQNTQYTVKMTRGDVCEAEASTYVQVVSNPEVLSIDSVGYREREIAVEGHGYDLAYVVDGDTFETQLIKDLRYSPHRLTVIQKVGNGLECTTETMFTVAQPPINVPDFFTPQGDGQNDKWMPSGINETYPDADFTIYDRWGKVLAKFKGADGGWDGTYNGQEMPSTDYWYEIHIREIDTTYTGHFTLLRR